MVKIFQQLGKFFILQQKRFKAFIMKIFITSTGTNVGKTYVTNKLIKCLKTNSNKKIYAIKPIISGFIFAKKPNDISEICEALGIKYNKEIIKKIARYFYKKPLSPDIAARNSKEEKVKISEIIKFTNQFKHYNTLIIEGAGGAFVPLNNTENTSDLIAKIADKIILVCGSYLGSLSHTISCFEAMKAKRIKPDFIIISQNLSKKDELYISEKETIKSLVNFIDIPIISLGYGKNFTAKEITKFIM